MYQVKPSIHLVFLWTCKMPFFHDLVKFYRVWARFISQIFTVTFLHVILSLLSSERKTFFPFWWFNLLQVSSKASLIESSVNDNPMCPAEELATNINKPFVISFFNQNPYKYYTYPQLSRNMFIASELILNFSMRGNTQMGYSFRSLL